jgi:hypothetical protein
MIFVTLRQQAAGKIERRMAIKDPRRIAGLENDSNHFNQIKCVHGYYDWKGLEGIVRSEVTTAYNMPNRHTDLLSQREREKNHAYLYTIIQEKWSKWCVTCFTTAFFLGVCVCAYNK